MRRAAILLVISLLAGAARPAHAEDPKKTAKKLLGEGDKLFGNGDYEGALSRYQKAFDAFPSAKIYYPMAQAEEKLGRDLDALTHYEMLLSEAGEVIPEQLKLDAAARIVEIKHRIVIVTFDVRPHGATITLDDVELGQAPLDAPVKMMPGDHKWVIAHQGYLPVEKELTLDPGMTLDEVVQLEKDEPTGPIVMEPARKKAKKSRRARPGSSQRTVLLAGITTTSVLGAAAIVTGLFAMSKHDVYSDPERSPGERDSARDTGKALAVTTDILWISAAAAGGFTVYWYYKVYKPALREKKPAPAPAALVPYTTGDGAGVVVWGSF